MRFWWFPSLFLLLDSAQNHLSNVGKAKYRARIASDQRIRVFNHVEIYNEGVSKISIFISITFNLCRGF